MKTTEMTDKETEERAREYLAITKDTILILTKAISTSIEKEDFISLKKSVDMMKNDMERFSNVLDKVMKGD